MLANTDIRYFIKRLGTLFLGIFLMYFSHAQGTWTWIGGDTVGCFNKYTYRGIKGVPSALNYPDSNLTYGNEGFTWKDKNGKVWILQVGYAGKVSTIWTYDPTSNIWTWVAGFDSFNIKANTPDSLKTHLKYMSSPLSKFQKWTDSLGNLWLCGVAYLPSSLFLITKFDINTLELEVVYVQDDLYSRGTIRLASPSNRPSITIRPTTWTMGQSAYVFGGYTLNGQCNELWKFDMTTKLWTWLGGHSENETSYNYNYGVKGNATSSNWPPMNVASSASWRKGNKLYLYGGYSRTYISYADLWEFDVNTGLWAWLEGPKNDTFKHEGIYPSKLCKDSMGIFPSGRAYANQCDASVCNNSFWMYAGIKGVGSLFIPNDLWLYKPHVNRWAWVVGYPDDTSYFYGVKGQTDIRNQPPARAGGLMWTDDKDRIYIFGGIEYNYWLTIGYKYRYGTDLWRYDPDYSCINYSLSEKFIDRNIKYKICVGDSTVVKVRSGYDSLRVIPTGSDVSIRTVAGDVEIWLKPSANKSYKIIAYGYRCESLLDSLTVPVVVSPPRTSSEAKTICYGASYMGKNTSGTYNFNYPDPLKCDSVHTLYLTVRPEIVQIIDSTVCEGTSVFGRSVSGTYNDPFTASNGCDSTRRLRLTVIPKNLLLDTVICRGQSLAGYTAAGNYFDTLTSTQGCVTYRVIKLTIKEPSSSSYSQAICEGQSYWGHSTTGTHTDILTAANGCDSARALNLSVNKKSYFTLNQEICRGESFEGKSQAGTYLDTFLNAKGCDSIRTLVLTLRNAKPIKKLKDTAICKGYDAVFNAGIGHVNYLWTTGATTPSIQVSQPGEYKLSYTDTANCLGLDSAKLSFYNDTEIILEDELSNYKGELLILNPKIKPSDVGGKYRWSPSHIFQCDSCRSARFKLDNSAVVRLEFTDAQGCKAYKDVVVNIYDSWAVGFPTAFSPNGDGTNDEYFPNVENILSYNIAIYNRWGEKVFSSNHLKQKWNGYYKGEAVPFGSYSYFAEVILLNQVRRTYTGTFHLVR